MSARDIAHLMRDTYNEWSEDKVARLGAAMAYYAVFSLAPLLLICISLAALFFGQDAAQGRILESLKNIIGPQAASAVQSIVASTSESGGGKIAGIVGLVIMLL